MATTQSGEFENALRRLEEIVTKLDGESISLDESVALFREGKVLAAQCETLLKSAQSSIEAASRGEQLAPQQPVATPARPPRSTTPLFGDTVVDDADPDL